MKRTINSMALAAIAALLVAAVPSAGSAHEYRAHCKSDIAKYCKDEKPGKKEHECLEDHESDLSADCKAHMEMAEKKSVACESEINQFCSADKGHPHKIHECLEAHKADLSQGCKDAHHWK